MDNNEIIVTGKKYRVWDAENSQWKRMSFYTQAEDMAFTDGLDAETKVGAINGITSSLASTSKNYALSASAGKDLKAQIDNVNTNLNKKSRIIVEMVTLTGNGSNWILVSSNNRKLIAAQSVRDDTAYYIMGIQKQSATGMYTLIFSGNIGKESKQTVWLTWLDN